jgi:hypothetical protein
MGAADAKQIETDYSAATERSGKNRGRCTEGVVLSRDLIRSV